MADEVDRLFTNFFSGMTEKQLAFAKWEIRQRIGNTEENIGGSRGSRHNGQRSLVENNLIREESDPIIRQLEKEIRIVRDFCSTIRGEDVTLLQYRYDRKNHLIWPLIANKMFKSERQCKRRLNYLKKEFRKSLWWNDTKLEVVDNLHP